MKAVAHCKHHPECLDGRRERFLGGCDVRNAHAPIRLDGGEEVLDARKKLDRLAERLADLVGSCSQYTPLEKT